MREDEFLAEPLLAVAFAVERAVPKPALVGAALVDLRPKECDVLFIHGTNPPVGRGRGVTSTRGRFIPVLTARRSWRNSSDDSFVGKLTHNPLLQAEYIRQFGLPLN
jgi:hypothetical protein